MSLRVDDLGEIVDCSSMAKAIDKLAEIASEKAEHIRHYSTEALAESWDQLAARLLNDLFWMKEQGSHFE